MATYKIRFHVLAQKEWNKLDSTIQRQFQKKLAERMTQPRIQSAALHGMPNCYKIKLAKVGYRLVYQVDEGIVTITVIAVGKRDKGEVYSEATKRQ